MKKYLYILGIIVSLLMIIFAIYFFINIYFIFSSIEGQLYDGFGTPYSNGNPSSPYTLVGLACFFGGTSLFNYCNKKIKEV